MSRFELRAESALPRDVLYGLSTDVANFGAVFPEHFGRMEASGAAGGRTLATEEIRVLGIRLRVRTEHEAVPPGVHNVRILSGPLAGTVFRERYLPSGGGCAVVITVDLRTGRLPAARLLARPAARWMGGVLGGFVRAAERYSARRGG